MKVKILISCLLVIFTLNTYAQEESSSSSGKESPFKYGIKFGYDMYPITFKPQEMLTQLKNDGYQAGIFFQFGRNLYLQPEIYYASYLNQTSSLTTEKIESLRAPIMLGLRFLNLGLVSAHLMGGPVFSAKLSDLVAGMKLEELNRDWQVGVGVDLLGFITADVRYQLQNGVDFQDQLSNINNSTLNVTVGIKL